MISNVVHSVGPNGVRYPIPSLFPSFKQNIFFSNGKLAVRFSERKSWSIALAIWFFCDPVDLAFSYHGELHDPWDCVCGGTWSHSLERKRQKASPVNDSLHAPSNSVYKPFGKGKGHTWEFFHLPRESISNGISHPFCILCGNRMRIWDRKKKLEAHHVCIV